jgi:hypothetical protein
LWNRDFIRREMSIRAQSGATSVQEAVEKAACKQAGEAGKVEKAACKQAGEVGTEAAAAGGRTLGGQAEMGKDEEVREVIEAVGGEQARSEEEDVVIEEGGVEKEGVEEGQVAARPHAALKLKQGFLQGESLSASSAASVTATQQLPYKEAQQLVRCRSSNRTLPVTLIVV